MLVVFRVLHELQVDAHKVWALSVCTTRISPDFSENMKKQKNRLLWVKLYTGRRRRTFAVKGSLLSRSFSLVVVLVSHFRRHRNAFSGRLRDILGHAHPSSDDVVQERHPVALPLPRLVPLARIAHTFFIFREILGISAGYISRYDTIGKGLTCTCKSSRNSKML